MRLGDGPHRQTPHHFRIAAEREADVGVERPQIVDCALHRRDLRVRNRGLGGYFRQNGLAVGGHHQGLLLSQRGQQHAEWSDLGGRVQPDLLVSRPQVADDMIELEGRGKGRVDVSRDGGQGRLHVQTRDLRHCGQQRALVLAVAVLIAEDFRRGMGLIAPRAERQTDVAELLRDEAVDRAEFVGPVGQVLGELRHLGPHGVTGRSPVAFQIRVPVADLAPALKGRDLHRGFFRLVPGLSLPFLLT